MQQILSLNDPVPVFGSKHTSEKLEIVIRYLKGYATALKNQPFKLTYIDAFAGAGYYRPSAKEEQHPDGQLSFDDFKDEGLERLIDGSAKRSLAIDPGFDAYVFVEKNVDYSQELKKLKLEFPDKANRILIRNEDANDYLSRICAKADWTKNRALVFLDPFGMQVEWGTLEAIAKTRAIDVWYLFPTGNGIMRLLKNDTKISDANRLRLDSVFGTPDWYDAFYQTAKQADLFDKEGAIIKNASCTTIEKFFIQRLEGIFAGVAPTPYRLLNSKGSWLYSMCFAAGNPVGAKLALKIANHILKEQPWQRVRASSGLK